MRYFLIVGEASADLHASNLIRAIQVLDSEAIFMFMGGDLMHEASGTPPIVHYREVAFMGLVPVLRNFGVISRAAKAVQQALLKFNPDVVIPIDFSGFNTRYILPFVHKHLSASIAYYIAPKLWAWKKWRINKLRRFTDELLCILPFEEKFFRDYGLRAYYVGNPSVDAVESYLAQEKQDEYLNRPRIAVLSGSRKQELKANLQVMLEATRPLQEQYEVVIAGAPGLTEQDYTPYIENYPWARLVFSETYSLVSSSEVALVTSGTATLEVGLLNIPQVVCYRMGGQRISRWIFNHLFSTKYISLVNLILGYEGVVELIGAEVSAERLTSELCRLIIGGEKREEQLRSLRELRMRLGTDSCSTRAAERIVSLARSNQDVR